MLKYQAKSARESLYQRIHGSYADLPASERQVADLLLEHPEDLGLWTASELAERAAVSNATVTRVFRRLGYGSYDEARQMARQARAAGSPLYLGNRARLGDDAQPAARALADEVAALEATLSRVDPQMLADLSQALADARRIRTLGYRNSRFVADYAAASLAQLRPGVAPLLLPGQTRGESLIEIGPGDVVLAVGLRRRRRGFKDTVRALAARGARVVLIADGSIRETPALASWTVDCAVETSQFADSYAGAMALVRLIALEVAARLGKAGRDYLGEVEALRSELDELE